MIEMFVNFSERPLCHYHIISAYVISPYSCCSQSACGEAASGGSNALKPSKRSLCFVRFIPLVQLLQHNDVRGICTESRISVEISPCP